MSTYNAGKRICGRKNRLGKLFYRAGLRPLIDFNRNEEGSKIRILGDHNNPKDVKKLKSIINIKPQSNKLNVLPEEHAIPHNETHMEAGVVSPHWELERYSDIHNSSPNH